MNLGPGDIREWQAAEHFDYTARYPHGSGPADWSPPGNLRSWLYQLSPAILRVDGLTGAGLWLTRTGTRH